MKRKLVLALLSVSMLGAVLPAMPVSADTPAAETDESAETTEASMIPVYSSGFVTGRVIPDYAPDYYPSRPLRPAAQSYAVRISYATNGSLYAPQSSYRPGETVTISATPALRYHTSSISAYDDYGRSIYVNSIGNEMYSFTMPNANVTITAAFEQDPVPAPVPPANAAPMYRFYNPSLGEHFYTASAYERDMLKAKGWNYEGIGWYAPESGTPVFRLYNRTNSTHFFTTNAAERDNLIQRGWKYEGIAWYSGGSKPVYRQYDPRSGRHNYTTDRSEIQNLVRYGWRAEGIAWYGVQ